MQVVQGTAIDTAGNDNSGMHDPNFTKGEVQPKKCRDPFFALLGVVNFIAIVVVAGIYGKDTITQIENAVDGEDESEFEYYGVIMLIALMGVLSLLTSFVMILIMMAIPMFLIKLSLIATIVLSGLLALFSFATGNMIGGIIGIIIFALGVCYARCVWDRIPFASANLKTACTSIKHNCGTLLVAIFFVILAFIMSFVWGIGFFGVFENTKQCDGNGENCTFSYVSFFFMALVYFFGHQIIQNTLHVSVAGAVGSWWFEPDSNGICGSAVCGGVIRAMTTSFGSICFGSLLVAIIQALRAVANQARQNGDVNPIIGCLVECLLSCLQGIIEYFNKWAFIYVGLYGYGYMEAGKNVMSLFKNRGWDAIIADDLVGNVFFLLSLVTGGIMGGIGYGIAIEGTLLKAFITEFGIEVAGYVGLGIGFVMGLILCSIFMGTISSAVNAVIVLFAEAPSEFESNYPELSSEMRAAWVGSYPDSLS